MLPRCLLAADRYLDFHFFTNDLGGNMMNYANLFWLFGHPEVYLLVLPAYGIYSEVFATFSAKRLYGYNSLVIATMSIAVTVIHRLVASLLHHGSKRVDQCSFRDCHDADRDTQPE